MLSILIITKQDVSHQTTIRPTKGLTLLLLYIEHHCPTVEVGSLSKQL